VGPRRRPGGHQQAGLTGRTAQGAGHRGEARPRRLDHTGHRGERHRGGPRGSSPPQASAGLGAQATASGTRAAWHRAGSSVPDVGQASRGPLGQGQRGSAACAGRPLGS